jgi:hypothetical protein
MSTTKVEPGETLETGTGTEAEAEAVGVLSVPIPGLDPDAPAEHEVGRPEGEEVVAAFCFEPPDGFIGQYAGRMAAAMAEGGRSVHLFTRQRFTDDEPGVRNHALGECTGEGLLGMVEEFTRCASNAFLRQFPAGTQGVTLLGFEWSAMPALSLLHAIRNYPAVASFHSLEWERSDMSGETSWRIAEIELAGLREAQTIVVHQASTAKHARRRVPESAGRIVEARQYFPCGSPVP